MNLKKIPKKIVSPAVDSLWENQALASSDHCSNPGIRRFVESIKKRYHGAFFLGFANAGLLMESRNT
jgi:hypothetical protein